MKEQAKSKKRSSWMAVGSIRWRKRESEGQRGMGAEEVRELIVGDPIATESGACRSLVQTPLTKCKVGNKRGIFKPNAIYLVFYGRKVFIRIHQSLWIEHFLDPPHHLNIFVALGISQVFVLCNSQTMFSRYRSVMIIFTSVWPIRGPYVSIHTARVPTSSRFQESIFRRQHSDVNSHHRYDRIPPRQ